MPASNRQGVSSDDSSLRKIIMNALDKFGIFVVIGGLLILAILALENVQSQ